MSDVKTGAKMYVLRLGSMTCDTNALVAFDTRATALDPEPKCKFEPFPVWGLYIEHPDGKIIFDTGFREDCLTGGEGPTVPINVPITLGEEEYMEKQLALCGVTPEEIDYVNAHGTGTHLNDLTETAALKLAMGEAAYHCKVNSTKSMVGHLLGAAGGVEAIACVKAIQENYVHKNAGLVNRDPECDLDCVTEAVETPVNVAMSNSLGFGGHNATLIFKAYEA